MDLGGPGVSRFCLRAVGNGSQGALSIAFQGARMPGFFRVKREDVARKGRVGGGGRDE